MFLVKSYSGSCSPWPERFAPHHVKRRIDRIPKGLIVRMRASMNRSHPVVHVGLHQVRVLRVVVWMDHYRKVGFPIDMGFRDPLKIHREH